MHTLPGNVQFPESSKKPIFSAAELFYLFLCLSKLRELDTAAEAEPRGAEAYAVWAGQQQRASGGGGGGAVLVRC